jgi:hypothetical protein
MFRQGAQPLQRQRSALAGRQLGIRESGLAESFRQIKQTPLTQPSEKPSVGRIVDTRRRQQIARQDHAHPHGDMDDWHQPTEGVGRQTTQEYVTGGLWGVHTHLESLSLPDEFTVVKPAAGR